MTNFLKASSTSSFHFLFDYKRRKRQSGVSHHLRYITKNQPDCSYQGKTLNVPTALQSLRSIVTRKNKWKKQNGKQNLTAKEKTKKSQLTVGKEK